ncbi:hypothetical protein [Reyranella sp.]|uniref:hypothetical protein n=1 Tax=Reyranella sp. TaxID=1929291 RepID=UPI003BAB5253
MTRSVETTVTFHRPFTLAALDGVQPAGTYRLVTEQEEIAGLSFVAYQRVGAWLHVPAHPAPGATSRVVPVSADELAAALAPDPI